MLISAGSPEIEFGSLASSSAQGIASWRLELHSGTASGSRPILRAAAQWMLPDLPKATVPMRAPHRRPGTCSRYRAGAPRAQSGFGICGRRCGVGDFAEKPAMRPSEMSRSDIQALRGAVLDDGRMSEIFRIGRHLNGRGVSNQGGIVGRVPTPTTTDHRPAATTPPNSRCRAAYASRIQAAVDL